MTLKIKFYHKHMLLARSHAISEHKAFLCFSFCFLFFIFFYLMNLFERDFLVLTIYKKLNVIMKSIARRAREGQNSFGYQQWHH